LSILNLFAQALAGELPPVDETPEEKARRLQLAASGGQALPEDEIVAEGFRRRPPPDSIAAPAWKALTGDGPPSDPTPAESLQGLRRP